MSQVTRVDGKIFCEACGEHVELSKYRLHIRYAHKDINKKPKKEYLCEICHKSFTSNYNLKYHLAHHYNLKDFVCDQCPNAYNTQSDLNQHKRTHDKGRGAFMCSECAEIFENQFKLDAHMKSIHHKLNRSYECTICHRILSSPWHLKEHTKAKHTSDQKKLFRCEECGKILKTNFALKIHVDFVHRGLKKYKCVVCGKAFGNPKDRRKHELLHEKGRNATYCTYCKKYISIDIVQHDQTVHGDFKFTCKVCKRKFATAGGLNRHKLKQHTNKNFTCDLCGIKMPDKYHLRCHIQTHVMGGTQGAEKTAAKVLDCSICGKHFNYPRSVVRHILSVHEKIKDFECEICSRKFSDKGDLNKHIVKIHQKEGNFCEICKIKVEDMREHFETLHSGYEFCCEFCPSRYQSLSSLNYHKKLKHLMALPEEPNFEKECKLQCSLCDKTFSTKKKLNRHIKIHERDDNEDIAETKVRLRKSRKDKSINCLELVNVKLEPLDESFDCAFDDIDIQPEVKMESYENETIEEVILPVKVKQETSDNNSSDEDWSDLKNFNDYSDEELKHDVSNEIPKEKKKFDTSQVLSRAIEKIPLEKDGKRLQVRCKICCATFTSVIGYREHFMEKHADDEEDIYDCKECQLIFDNRKDQKFHFRLVHKTFNCTECKRVFASQYQLDEHLKDHDSKNNQQQMCTYCGKIYATSVSLKAHIDAIHTKCRFKCDMCEKSYSFKAALYKHRLLIHLEGKKHKCPLCDYLAGSKHEIRLHHNNHHTSNRENTNDYYFCAECGISFHNGSTLKRHLYQQHGRKLLFRRVISNKCALCQEPTNSSYYAEKHYAQVHHNGEKPMRQCGFCKVEIKLYDDYVQHLKIHSGVFFCLVCGSPFFTEESLTAHLPTHRSLEKKLRKCSCDHCGHRTFTKFQMLVHLSKHFENPQPNTCEICGKTFRIASSLYTHRMYHSEGTIPCEHCGKKFVRNSDLNYHIKKDHTHEKPFKCIICGSSYISKQALKHHLQTHPQTMEVYSCEECKISFGNNKKEKDKHNHIYHPEKKPYRCLICNKSFTHEHNFERHNGRHLKI